MSINFGYSFPAICGIQANREYYVSMCPLRLIPKIFLFNEEEMAPELRAQRRLNRSRLPELARYITGNRENYVFSAITASVDGKIEFEPFEKEGDGRRVGLLHIPMEARFIINDGQHRRAAIEMAISERPEIGDESIAVVLFLDPGLERCQQMFADLNRYAIRPSTSLGILYDHRDTMSLLSKRLIGRSGIFRDLVEPEKTTLSARSRRLFTLSAIYHATQELLWGRSEPSEKLVKIAGEFWEVVAKQIREWQQVRDGKITAGEIRQDYIHSHAVALQALGRAGNNLLMIYPDDWKRRLQAIAKMDWRRANSILWEGRALTGGRVSKGQQNITLTANAIKKQLGLPLSPEEERLENFIRRE